MIINDREYLMKFLAAKLQLRCYPSFKSGLINVYILIHRILLILSPETKFTILKSRIQIRFFKKNDERMMGKGF